MARYVTVYSYAVNSNNYFSAFIKSYPALLTGDFRFPLIFTALNLINQKSQQIFHILLLNLQLIILHSFKFLNGYVFLIRVCIYKCFVYILQVVLDLVICRTDDRLEAKTTDQ